MTKYFNTQGTQSFINKLKFGNSALKTNSKTLVGAINELKLAIDNLPQPQDSNIKVAGYSVSDTDTTYNAALGMNYTASGYAKKLSTGRIFQQSSNYRTLRYTDDNGATFTDCDTSALDNVYSKDYATVINDDFIVLKYTKFSGDNIGTVGVSTDKGETFHKVPFYNGYLYNIIATNIQNVLIGIAPDSAKTGGNANYCDICISTDGGETWSEPLDNRYSMFRSVTFIGNKNSDCLALRCVTSSNNVFNLLIKKDYSKILSIESTSTPLYDVTYIDDTHIVYIYRSEEGSTFTTHLHTAEINQDDTITVINYKNVTGSGNEQRKGKALKYITKYNNEYYAIGGDYVLKSGDCINWTTLADFSSLTPIANDYNVIADNCVVDNVIIGLYKDTSTNDVRCKCSSDYGNTWNDALLLDYSQNSIVIKNDSSGYWLTEAYYNYIHPIVYVVDNKIIIANGLYDSSYTNKSFFFGYRYTTNSGATWQNTGDMSCIFINSKRYGNKITAKKFEVTEASDGTDWSTVQLSYSKCIVNISN